MNHTRQWIDALKEVPDPTGQLHHLLTAMAASLRPQDDREILIPVFNIRIHIVKGHGQIASDLRAPFNTGLHNAAIDGLEQTILAHAVAGVDVNTADYWKGIEDAANAITDKYEE